MLSQVALKDICVCSVVKAELFYGSMKSRHPERNLAKQKQFLERFLSLPFNDKAAEAYGTIRASLEKAGNPIGPNDLMIAAIAFANAFTLVSHNTREFKRVEIRSILQSVVVFTGTEPSSLPQILAYVQSL